MPVSVTGFSTGELDVLLRVRRYVFSVAKLEVGSKRG